MNCRTCLTGILMLVVCLTAADLSAQGREAQGRERGLGRGGRGMGRGQQTLFSLAGNPAVQKDLDTKEEQNAKLAKLIEDYFTQIRDAAPFNRDDFQDASDEERAKLMAEMQKKMADANKAATEKLKPELAKILDEKQLKRLREIQIQSLQGAALSDAEVAAALKINDEQKGKIEKENQDFQAKQTALMNPDAGGDPTDRFAKFRELGEEHNKALLALLTDDQRKELDTLKGAEFDLAQLRGGGRRGGEGRGFGGGPGGGGPNPGGRPQRRPADSEKPASEKSDAETSKSETPKSKDKKSEDK